MLHDRRLRINYRLNVAFFMVLWADFVMTLYPEWAINDQYSYGFFVPILSLYLIFNRKDDRPLAAGKTTKIWTVAIFLALIPLIPVRVILGTNPDWRLALWIYASIILTTSIIQIYRVGGIPWVRHYLSPLLLMLFAIPWPTFIENPIVLTMMENVAIITVDLLNLFGVFAERYGNVIQLSNGLVGIEEACSGVRSLQSTLMAAFFFGSLFRWRMGPRLALLFTGVVISLLLNMVRTLTLTWITASRGNEAMEVLHDPIGHFISITSYACLFILTWVIDHYYHHHNTSQNSINPNSNPKIVPFNKFTTISLILLIIFTHLFSWNWYHIPITEPSEKYFSDIRWNNLSYDYVEESISPQIQALLRYTEGKEAKWTDDDGTHWKLFFFFWEGGSVSSHVAVHRPEVCLPSAGFKLIHKEPAFSIEKEELKIPFESYIFEINENSLYVFYAVWNSANTEIELGSTAKDRIKQAWNGFRIDDRYSLQIILSNVEDMDSAKVKAEDFVRRKLKFDKTTKYATE